MKGVWKQLYSVEIMDLSFGFAEESIGKTITAKGYLYDRKSSSCSKY